MNLVKWLRRNNVKVMAVVFIVTMFGFIGGAYIRQFSMRKKGLRKTIAYFGNNRKITNYDIHLARRELETLDAPRRCFAEKHHRAAASRAGLGRGSDERTAVCRAKNFTAINPAHKKIDKTKRIHHQR